MAGRTKRTKDETKSETKPKTAAKRAEAPKGTPLILFAHGAGVGSSSPWMKAWAKRLGTLGKVVTFDYPYMAAGKKLPDRLPVLLEAHRAALAKARRNHDGPVIFAGKSMGSRVSCHLAVSLWDEGDRSVRAVVCFGYPLVSPSKKATVRSEVLEALRTPILFAEGTNDPLCPLPLLATTRKTMRAKSELFEVEGGDHSLVLSAAARKARGITQDESDESVLRAVTKFVTKQTR